MLTTVLLLLAADPGEWSFRNHVVPILTRLGCSSGACHGALAGKGGLKLSLRGYDIDADHFALTRQALGRRIDRERPADSLFLRKPTLAQSHGGGLRLEAGSREYRILSEWVASGAKGPSKDDPRLTRLDVSPTASTLKPGETVRLTVTAQFSDGRKEDVTAWSRFVSSDEEAATVDATGKVAALGPGEAAISAQLSNLLATSRVTIPYPNKVEDRVYREAPRSNFIDEHILRKLAELRLPPSPGCTDEELLRRAYLDVAGILPTPEEQEAFLASTDPRKREKMIDRLLARAEYTDFWSYKWSDLFLITTRRLPQPAVWAFHQYVRQSVADNKPWSQLSREVLTASGSTLRNGAANFFVLHKDVSELTEATAVTFLGMSVTCARCHNHPLERWTQDEYWQLANLFSRVGLKNGGRAGDVLVQPEASGEAYHPRRGIAMQPTPLGGKPISLDSTEDRRKTFAEWLTADDNPYFARALVNRVWRQLMGRGLVEPEDDLRESNPPTNAALLDALSADFIRGGYDVKRLIRTILLSAAYQRSSRPVPGNERDTRFYSRYLVRRLQAEVLLDAYSQVTGVPTSFTHLHTNARDSTTPYAGFPLGTRALQLPDSLVVSPFLDAFGRPERAQPCSCERASDGTVAQALHLNNGKTLNEKLRQKGSLAAAWAAEKSSDEALVRRLFRRALCREPSKKELATFTRQLAEAGDAGRREAVEDLFWAVLTSRDFVFNR
jgi:hypothetical protein